MPYKIRKIPNENYYRVKNADTGKVMSNKTTKEKAEAQVRLLMSLERKIK